MQIMDSEGFQITKHFKKIPLRVKNSLENFPFSAMCLGILPRVSMMRAM